jgi:hypothetical protein
MLSTSTLTFFIVLLPRGVCWRTALTMYHRFAHLYKKQINFLITTFLSEYPTAPNGKRTEIWLLKRHEVIHTSSVLSLFHALNMQNHKSADMTPYLTLNIIGSHLSIKTAESCWHRIAAYFYTRLLEQSTILTSGQPIMAPQKKSRAV